MKLHSFFQEKKPRNIRLAKKNYINLRKYLDTYLSYLLSALLILGLLVLFIDKYIGWQELFQNLAGYSSGYALPLFLSLALLFNSFIHFHRSRTLVKYGKIVEVHISNTGIIQFHTTREAKRRSPWLHIQVKKRGPKQWIDANVRGVEYQWNVPNRPLYVVFHEDLDRTLLILGEEVIESSGLKRKEDLVVFN